MQVLTLSQHYINHLVVVSAQKTGRHPLWIRRRIIEAVDYFNQHGEAREGYEGLTKSLLEGQ